MVLILNVIYMNVAIIQTETRFIGGIERITEAILAHGGWKDSRMHVVFLRSGPMVDRVSGFFPAERTAVFEAGRLRQVPRTIATITRIARQLRRWKIDVVLSQGFHSQCYGGPAARLAGAKNLFWCHGMLGAAELGDKIVRLAVRLPADLVLGFPASNVPNLQRQYRGRCSAELLYPSDSLAPFLASQNDCAKRSEMGIARDAPVIAVVGRLQSWKGQDVFIRAAAIVAEAFPSARFLVVGGPSMAGDEDYEAGLKQLARQLGVAGSVLFCGEREDVPELMGASDIVVHTSTVPEPFGLVVIEAMAAGRPVVATRGGGPSEIISEGRTGFLTTPGDHRELAATLCLLIQDSELRHQIGQAARNDALARFSPERMAKKLEDIIHSMNHSTRTR